MSRYANKTSVPVERSMGQVRSILAKNDSDGVAIAETRNGAVVQFIFEGKPYKFPIFYPNGNEDWIKYTGSGKLRTDQQIDTEKEAEKRRLWRAMVLYIKAAIEAHTNGLIDLKRSMMGHMMLPNGSTVFEAVENDLPKFNSNPSLLLELK